jgi:hypothetical protein
MRWLYKNHRMFIKCQHENIHLRQHAFVVESRVNDIQGGMIKKKPLHE